jgi:hypothetical protein
MNTPQMFGGRGLLRAFDLQIKLLLATAQVNSIEKIGQGFKFRLKPQHIGVWPCIMGTNWAIMATMESET